MTLVACQGLIGETVERPEPPPVPSVYEPQAPVLPRLTERQYRAAVATLLGDPLPALRLPPDTNPFLFYSIGATTTALSEVDAQQLEEAADRLARSVFDDPARRGRLVGCVPSGAGDACSRDFIAGFGRRVYRRPLTAEEASRWLSVAMAHSDEGAWDGLRAVVAGMLQSPHFVYRIELGEPDPEDPARLRLTRYELASRMAFVLWNGIPDEPLLDAAEQGALDTPEGIATRARLMLADPRARASLLDFFDQYFDLGGLEGISRAAEHRTFTPTLVAAMRTEMMLLVEDVVLRRNLDVRKLFSTRRTFLNSELAAHYELDAPGATPITFVPVTLPSSGPRAGMLTLGAFLTMNAHEATTSPTLRGKYVRERILCSSVPPPPADVDTGLEEVGAEPVTMRERLAQHRQNPTCATCHALIDPPGLLFEAFDPVGRHRTLEQGQPIDTSGDLDGVHLSGPLELAALLERSEAVSQCMVKQLYRHAQGRLDSRREKRALEEIHAAFAAQGFRFRELLVALVSHESFQQLAPAEEEP